MGREYLGADSHTAAPEPLNHGADKQVTSPLACVLLLPHLNSDELELDWFLLPACCCDKRGDKGARAKERVCFGSGSEGVKVEGVVSRVGGGWSAIRKIMQSEMSAGAWPPA